VHRFVIPTGAGANATAQRRNLLFPATFDPDLARVGRTLLSDAFNLDLDFGPACHPEEAESHAKGATPDEGPMQPG
jgi:hypothetical protein